MTENKEQAPPPEAGRWDYIVIGAGAAGAIVASRLSENPSHRVLLLEAGPSDRLIPNLIPGLGFLAVAKRETNWFFETEAMPELKGRRQIWHQGKLLGGGSSINGMIYTRGHAREYDLWRQMGCSGWSFEEVLPYFKKSEANARGADAWHGGGGPISIRPSAPALPIYDEVLAACRQSGLPVLEDLNRNTLDGFGYYDVNIGRGRRASTAARYLRPARRRANLTVWTGATAQRILFEGERASGVLLLHEGQPKRVAAGAEIVLCGGAIKSPHLLMLSGIGPGPLLQEAGIAVRAHAPEVGRNLQNHPSYRMQYLCRGPVTAYGYVRPLGALKAGLSYLLARRGGLAESIFGAGGFFRTRPELELPDIQVVMCAALTRPPATATPRMRDLLPKEQGFTVIVYQGTPYSRGEVTLRSADPAAQPVIRPGYFTDPRDLPVLLAGIKRMRAVLTGPGGPASITREIAPGPEVRDDAALEEVIRATVTTSFHQCGTCAMGPHPTNVLDPELRVRGVTGLRVADASVMPVMPNAALQGPVMMIGEKAAAMIAGKG